MEYLKNDSSFDRILSRMNSALAAEFSADTPTSDTHLTGQIVGLPRSGTTILYQLLARTGQVGYPSNVMAYFWDAPHVGARLQNRLARNGPTLSLNSLAGRTSEPLDPHEFGLFWRNVLGHSKNSMLADGNKKNAGDLRVTLDLINDAFSSPTVFKNFLAPAHVDYLSSEVGRQRYFLVQRDLLEVAASIFKMRQKLNVEPSEWFGPAPEDVHPEYGSVHEMVAHQVVSLHSLIEKPSFKQSADTQIFELSEVCRRPRDVVSQILMGLGVEFDRSLVESTVPEELETAKGYSGVDRVALRRLESELNGFIK